MTSHIAQDENGISADTAITVETVQQREEYGNILLLIFGFITGHSAASAAGNLHEHLCCESRH